MEPQEIIECPRLKKMRAENEDLRRRIAELVEKARQELLGIKEK